MRNCVRLVISESVLGTKKVRVITLSFLGQTHVLVNALAQ